MSFHPVDFYPIDISQDLWPALDDFMSAGRMIIPTRKEPSPLDPSMVENSQDSSWSFPTNGVPRASDLCFGDFGREQYSVDNRETSERMLHSQGTMIASGQGPQGRPTTSAVSDNFARRQKRQSRIARRVSGGRPPKRKRTTPKTEAYYYQETLDLRKLRSYRDGAICDEDCDSNAGSVTTCCSSCSEGPLCEDPHCAIPCAEPSCEIPICADDCPEVCPGTLAQDMQFQQSFLPTSQEDSFLQESTAQLWTSADSTNFLSVKEVYSDVNPALPEKDSDYQHQPGPESSIPPTPSMEHNISTPYSPEAAIQTPQFMSQNQHNLCSNETSAIVSASAMFPSSNSGWRSDNLTDSGDGAWTFNCPWDACNAAIPDQQFWMHLHQEHLDPQYNYDCPLQSNECPTTLANPLTHLQTQHGFAMNESFTCPAPTCSPAETYNDPAMFHNHFDLAHATPAQGFLHCRLNSCNNSFVDQSQLLSHIQETHQLPNQDSKVATVAEPQQCPLETAEDNGLVAHTCNWKLQGGLTCKEIYRSEKDLQDHVKVKHLAPLSKSTGYICQWEHCNRPAKMGSKQGFSQRGKLERHMASHTNFKCSECDICHQMFSAEQAMKQHRLLHTGEKPWKCKYCEKRFPQQSACTIHERTHTKDKPLECEICGKKFSESSNFAKHRRIHGELGKLACEYPNCGKTFHRSDQLKKHMEVHSKNNDASGKRVGATSDEATDDESSA